MGGFLRRHIATTVVAMVTAAVTAGGPALAHGVQHALFAHDSSKVDGKDAVGAGASLANRAGKLIATNNSGRLPNNIITKAPDANRLDGLNSTAFLRSNGKAADADQLDGLDSTAFLGSTGKAADADMLDGKDSTQFVETSDSRLSDARQPTDNSVTSAKVIDGSLRAGDVATLRWRRVADVPSVGANACYTLTYLNYIPTQVGDIVITAPPSNLPTTLIAPTMAVPSANMVSIRLCNIGTAAVDPPITTFDLTILRP